VQFKHSLVILIFLMSALWGCENVTSKYPLGAKPYPISSEQWAGDWSTDCSGEEAVKIEVLDKDKGVIRITDMKTGPEESLSKCECYLMEAGNWIFANAVLKDEAELYPVRIKNVEGRQIIVWFPDADKFRRLVDQKILPGELHGESISLGPLKSEHLELIMSGKEGVLFKWDEPSILVRRGPAAAHHQ